MTRGVPALLAALLLAAAGSRAESDWQRLFDGKTLEGWRSPDMGFWSVEDGAITARSTDARPCRTNQFLVWQGGEIANFVLRLQFKIEGPPGANSGIQFRSRIREDGHAVGYQADIDREGRYLGALYDEETGRGMLAERGQRTAITADGMRRTTRIADAGELLKRARVDGWNDYEIRAEGRKLRLKINERTTAEVEDYEVGHFDAAGRLALQLHSGPPTTVRFRDLRLRRHPD